MSPRLSDYELDLKRIAVVHSPYLSSRSFRRLREALGHLGHAWDADLPTLITAGVSAHSAERFASWRRKTSPEALLDVLRAESINIVWIDDADYPPLLRETSDPPEALFFRGNLEDHPSVAIVGSRKYTAYGHACVDLIVPDLVRHGMCITSGLALGIDSLAHRAALESDGKTVAVLGTGIDRASVYPREHAGLAERIIAEGGAVVSEFPPGSGSRKEHFPMRNRIIAGLCLATVVVEAREDSGSLITAKLALEENREVLAVPGPITNPASSGPNRLLLMGAKPCLSARSVIEAVALDRPDLARDVRSSLPLTPLESRILSSLDEEAHVDELARRDGTPPAEVSAALALLELKGYISSSGGQCWHRV